MANYHWKKKRKIYKLSYTLYIGGKKVEREKTSANKTYIKDLLAATSELETAARTGIASTESILGWVQREFIEEEEANLLFPGYQQAAERAGLLIAAPDFPYLKRRYRIYCENNHRKGKSGYDGWGRGDKVIAWLKKQKKPLRDLEESDCEAFVSQILSTRSAQTAAHYLTTLRIILDIAQKKRMITYNPARSVEPPVIDDATERTILTADQIAWVKEASLRPHHNTLLCGGIATAVRLGLYAGLRNGEMNWLRWSRVDLKKGVVTIAKTVDGDTEWVPKDFESRTIDIKQEAVDYLRELKKISVNDSDDGFVLQSDPERNPERDPETGKWLISDDIPRRACGKHPIYAGALSKAFNTFMKREQRYGEYTVYSFRHTYATSMLRSGVDIRTVQELMGHEKITTTMKYLRPLRAEDHPSDALAY